MCQQVSNYPVIVRHNTTNGLENEPFWQALPRDRCNLVRVHVRDTGKERMNISLTRRQVRIALKRDLCCDDLKRSCASFHVMKFSKRRVWSVRRNPFIVCRSIVMNARWTTRLEGVLRQLDDQRLRRSHTTQQPDRGDLFHVSILKATNERDLKGSS